MTRTRPAHLSVLVWAIMIVLALATATSPAILGAHAATSTISLISSGLVASDSLTTGNTAAWAIGGNAPPGGSASNENSSGLYLGVKTGTAGTWSGFFAKSSNTNAMLFHAVLTLPYKTIPDNVFDTGLYVQTSNTNFINYVTCVTVVGTAGYYWGVVQATGPALGAITTTNLWTSPTNTMPLTQDCTIITNGQNYLKVYLGGNVVYQSSSLMLNMPAPYNSFLEVQTNSASAMRFGSYLSYYATLNENVTVTNAPAGGTVKIVDSLNNLLASAPVSSTGRATLPIGKFRLPLTANIQTYDSTNTLVASTTSPISIWGGDAYTVTPPPPGPVSPVTQTKSGLDHFDSLATGDLSYWTIYGSAPEQAAPYKYSENSTGLYLGVQSNLAGTWAGLFAESPNTNATAYHVVMTLPYKTIPDNYFNTGMYVQTSDPNYINYVACGAQVIPPGVAGTSPSGYQWLVVQAYGVVAQAFTTTVLWAGPLNTGPLTQDCTLITNGQNYLKVYLGGNVVYQSSSLNLVMSSPFNSYIEVQTSSASAMRWSNYVYYYSMFGENVTVTNAPPGGTVKIVDSSNNVLASGPVSSVGTATLPVGSYRLPLTAFIKVYDSTNNLVASTSSAVTIWGGDIYRDPPGFTPTTTTSPCGTTTGDCVVSSFAGSASSLAISTPLATTAFGSTGQLPSSGGEVDSTPISVQTQLGTAEVLHSYATGFDRQAESGAALGDLVLLAGTPNQITADAVISKSVAGCAGASGYSDITNLQMSGQQIAVSGQPNQAVTVPGVLTLVMNEQIVSGKSITVNALHLSTVDGTNVIVSSASSAITCLAPLGHLVHDFVTGGGWIMVGNAKGTFGFVAGYKNGWPPASGNLVFIDHGTKLKVKATSVSNYWGYQNSRTFTGTADVNGQPGCSYSVTVTDNGNAGAGRYTFSLKLSGTCGFSGYSASGTLGGGSIRFHYLNHP